MCIPLFCPSGLQHHMVEKMTVTRIHRDLKNKHTFPLWQTCCRLSGTGLLSKFPGGIHLDQTVISIHSAGFFHPAHVEEQQGEGTSHATAPDEALLLSLHSSVNRFFFNWPFSSFSHPLMSQVKIQKKKSSIISSTIVRPDLQSVLHLFTFEKYNHLKRKKAERSVRGP